MVSFGLRPQFGLLLSHLKACLLPKRKVGRSSFTACPRRLTSTPLDFTVLLLLILVWVRCRDWQEAAQSSDWYCIDFFPLVSTVNLYHRVWMGSCFTKKRTDSSKSCCEERPAGEVSTQQRGVVATVGSPLRSTKSIWFYNLRGRACVWDSSPAEKKTTGPISSSLRVWPTWFGKCGFGNKVGTKTWCVWSFTL